MTVAELIAKLKKLPKNAIVMHAAVNEDDCYEIEVDRIETDEMHFDALHHYYTHHAPKRGWPCYGCEQKMLLVTVVKI